MKIVTMTFEFEDDEFEEFMEKEDVSGQLHDWLFAELCQNNSFGMLTDLKVTSE